MRRLNDVFAIWPSKVEMADELGEKPSTVSKWLRRGRIPDTAWPILIRKATGRGAAITADDLMRLNAKSKPRGGGSPLHPNHPRAI
jgi:hypothetical protein